MAVMSSNGSFILILVAWDTYTHIQLIRCRHYFTSRVNYFMCPCLYVLFSLGVTYSIAPTHAHTAVAVNTKFTSLCQVFTYFKSLNWLTSCHLDTLDECYWASGVIEEAKDEGANSSKWTVDSKVKGIESFLVCALGKVSFNWNINSSSKGGPRKRTLDPSACYLLGGPILGGGVTGPSEEGKFGGQIQWGQMCASSLSL